MRSFGLGVLIAMSAVAPAAATEVQEAPVCWEGDDCKVKWGRAAAWVMQHGANIVQRTDDFIMTQPGMLYGEDDIRINRIPQGDGQYVIAIQFNCAAIMRCKPKTTVNDFINYVNAVP